MGVTRITTKIHNTKKSSERKIERDENVILFHLVMIFDDSSIPILFNYNIFFK